MRHRITLMFLLLFLGFFVPLEDYPTAHALVPPNYSPTGPGDVYLALGDSLATGTEYATNNDGFPGYPNIVLEQLQRSYPALRYENLADDGTTTSSMLVAGGQLDTAIIRIAELRASGQRAGLVTLSIGGNDILSILPPTNADPTTTLATFETNVATILDRLQAALRDEQGGIQGDLLVMDFYNPYPGLPLAGIGELASVWIPKFNTSIHTIAAARGIPVAEVAQAFAGHEEAYIFVQWPYPASMIEPDLLRKLDYHPRLAGHQVIANKLLNVSEYTLVEPERFWAYLPMLKL